MDTEILQALATPEQVADWLRSTGLDEGEILDLLKRTADATGGWTPNLNRVGLLILKPNAPSGREKEA